MSTKTPLLPFSLVITNLHVMLMAKLVIVVVLSLIIIIPEEQFAGKGSESKVDSF